MESKLRYKQKYKFLMMIPLKEQTTRPDLLETYNRKYNNKIIELHLNTVEEFSITVYDYQNIK